MKIVIDKHVTIIKNNKMVFYVNYIKKIKWFFLVKNVNMKIAKNNQHLIIKIWKMVFYVLSIK